MSQPHSIKDAVLARYTEVAQGQSCCGTDCCGQSRASDLSRIGYEATALAELPTGAVAVGAGCGNPTALAQLRPGEVVLDLGSGGGLDALLAARIVGPRGRVIGVDMTPAMLDRARANAAQAGAHHVEFVQGQIEALPLEESSVDVVISNCVINLSTDKGAVFSEALRVLRPGGRLLVSDLVSVGELDLATRQSAAAWAGCIAGALDREDYLGKIRKAGFTQVEVVAQSAPLEGHPIVSISVRAVKPACAR